MNNLTLNDLLTKVAEYNEEEIDIIKKAYYFAEELHKGQKRQSGEDYIIHPLNVAYTLAEMHADRDTICAALLHDTLEDTEITKEEIAENFNETVAHLVEGVTKISRMNFATKLDQNMANTRKIITSITDDVRIIIIKLADRLHNMRTLQYKSELKQKENAEETLLLYVPLADRIGAHTLKTELEDLSLQYLYPDEYKSIEEKRFKIEEDSKDCLQEMLESIHSLLENKNVPHEIKTRVKNIYGIYKKMKEGKKLSEIHDLLTLKVMVDSFDNCFLTLEQVRSNYHEINSRFKDYINNPKPNMYRSLHTTVYGPEDKLVQTQIRTFDMDKIASYGLTAYWDINKGDARRVMQEELRNKYQFFDSLVEINQEFADNKAFVEQIKKEILSKRILVQTKDGRIIELPSDSTAIDLAYKIHTDIGNSMVAAIVNNVPVQYDYILHNKDQVTIITDTLAEGPKEGWLDKTKTTRAKRKIREYIRKHPQQHKESNKG